MRVAALRVGLGGVGKDEGLVANVVDICELGGAAEELEASLEGLR